MQWLGQFARLGAMRKSAHIPTIKGIMFAIIVTWGVCLTPQVRLGPVLRGYEKTVSNELTYLKKLIFGTNSFFYKFV